MPSICYSNTVDYSFNLQQRPHHIFNILASRGWSVYWVNQTKNPDRFRTKINDNLAVYHDWDKFVNKFKEKIDIYFSSWSNRWVDIEKLQPKLSVYDSLDLFPQNQSEERNMVDKADVILTTTNNLYDFHKQHTDKPMYMCENGCFTQFRNNTYDIPEDMKNLPKPWILFSGALSITPDYGWVDLDLIEKISNKYTLIVVGDIWGFSEAEKEHIKKTRLSKVKFLGYKDYNILQQYYANCDLNILPFLRNQTANFSFPLKLVEGCNFSKPCIASDIPVAVDFNNKYPKAVLTSRNKEQFMENIKLGLEIKDDKETIEQCHSLADEHDWNKKVDIIEQAINNFAESKGIIL